MFSCCSCLDNEVFCHIMASHAPTIPKIIAETTRSESKNNNISGTEKFPPNKYENAPLETTKIPTTIQNFIFIPIPPQVHPYKNPVTLAAFAD